VLSLGSTYGNSMTAIYVDREMIEGLTKFAAARPSPTPPPAPKAVPTPTPPPAPKPVPTPWFATRTYSDILGRWSIEYASSWTLDSPRTPTVFSAFQCPPALGWCVSVAVQEYPPLAGGETLSDAVEEYKRSILSGGARLVSETRTNVKGLSAVEIEYAGEPKKLPDGTTQPPFFYASLVVGFGDSLYVVKGASPADQWSYYRDMLRATVYTFRPTLARNPPTSLQPDTARPSPLPAPRPTLPPSGYYGEVSLTGEWFYGRNVQDGTKIEVWIDGQKVAQTTTQTYNGKSVYNVDVVGDPSWEGKTVEFRLGTSVAPQKSSWRSGTNQQIALTFTAP